MFERDGILFVKDGILFISYRKTRIAEKFIFYDYVELLPVQTTAGHFSVLLLLLSSSSYSSSVEIYQCIYNNTGV